MEYKKDYQGFHFEKKDRKAIITFDNPRTLNALSYECFASLNELFDQLYRDREIWGLIFTGAGRSFIAGADLSGLPHFDASKESAAEHYRDDKKYIHDTYNKIANYERPTICAINGYALGGGAELALCCDVRIASTKAKIGFPEVNLGGIPGYTGPSRATKILGPAVTKEMMFSGRHYTAEEAKDLRFVSKVVEPEQLMPEAEKMMDEFLARAPIAIKATKLMIDRCQEMSYMSSLEYERLLTYLCSTTHDFEEGMTAFAEKRKPRFENK